MGKVKRHMQNCLRCGKPFSTREEIYCQKHRRENNDIHGEEQIHLVAKKVNLKEEVKGLLFLENRYPEVVERIRNKKFNSEKDYNSIGEKQ